MMAEAEGRLSEQHSFNLKHFNLQINSATANDSLGLFRSLV